MFGIKTQRVSVYEEEAVIYEQSGKWKWAVLTWEGEDLTHVRGPGPFFPGLPMSLAVNSGVRPAPSHLDAVPMPFLF